MRQNNQLISSQLEAAARAVAQVPASELAVVLLETGCAMLEQAQQYSQRVSRMEEEDFHEQLSSYMAISDVLERFCKEAQARPDNQANSLDLSRPMEDLKEARKTAEDQKTQLKNIRSELAKLTQENDAQEKELGERKKDVAGEKLRQEVLAQELEQASDEVLSRLRKENSDLVTQIAANVAEKNALEEDLRKKNKQILQQKLELSALEEEINAIPEESKRLLQEFREKQDLLSQLERAQQDCSEEKQQELEKRIQALQPVVDQLTYDMENKRNHLKHLENSRLSLDRKNYTLEGDLLQRVQAALGDLAPVAQEYEQQLNQFCAEAVRLDQNLEAALALRKKYSAWFQADRTPLEAMIQAVGTAESAVLRQTLDPAQCSELRGMISQTQQNLERMEQILKACAEAVWQDQKNLEGRVRI